LGGWFIGAERTGAGRVSRRRVAAATCQGWALPPAIAYVSISSTVPTVGRHLPAVRC